MKLIKQLIVASFIGLAFTNTDELKAQQCLTADERTTLTLKNAADNQPIGIGFQNNSNNYLWNLWRNGDGVNLDTLIISGGVSSDIRTLEPRFYMTGEGHVGIGAKPTANDKLYVGGDVTIMGTYHGNGSGLTHLNAANIEGDMQSDNIQVKNQLRFTGSSSSALDFITNTNNVDPTRNGLSVFVDSLEAMRFSHSGNAYINKSLAIGQVHTVVPGTQLTVSGAVHIGPETFEPDTFNYSSELQNYLLWVEEGIVSEDFAIVEANDWSDFVFEEDYELRPLEKVQEYIRKNGHLPDMPSEEEVKKNGYSLHEINKKLLQKIEELVLYTIEQEAHIRQQQKDYRLLDDRISSIEARLLK